MNQKRSWFNQLAKAAAHRAGLPSTFFLALFIIVVWGCTGPIFHYNDTWQLVINTSTTIITFLMVFLIQNAQNRDSAALQIKLDELLRAVDKAHNSLIDLEELEEHEVNLLRKKYAEIATLARKDLRSKNGFSEFDPEKNEFNESPKGPL